MKEIYIEELRKTKCPGEHMPVWVVFAIDKGGNLLLATVEKKKEKALELKEMFDKDESYLEGFIVSSMFNEK